MSHQFGVLLCLAGVNNLLKLCKQKTINMNRDYMCGGNPGVQRGASSSDGRAQEGTPSSSRHQNFVLQY
jgi:hypothetical protein